MKLSTVAEAIACEIDEPVLAIRATLSKLFKPISGTNEYGEWTLQNGAFKDETGEIKIVFSNRAEIPQSWREGVVEVRCTKGQKGGYSGIKRAQDKKTKLPTLSISEKAEVRLFTDEQPKSPPPAPANEPATAPRSPPQPSSDAGKGVIPKPEEYAASEAHKKGMAEAMADGMAGLYQIANTQYAAIMVVREYLVPLLKEKHITIDAQQEAALIQNMLIQTYYQRGHYNFPQKKLGIANKPPNGTPESG